MYLSTWDSAWPRVAGCSDCRHCFSWLKGSFSYLKLFVRNPASFFLPSLPPPVFPHQMTPCLHFIPLSSVQLSLLSNTWNTLFCSPLLQEIFGYRTQGCRKALCLIGSIFSLGMLPLVFYWRPAWRVWANCVPCSLQEADVVLLKTTVSIHLFLEMVSLFLYVVL